MPLKPAKDMKALASSLDLSPILDDISKTIESAATNGDLSTSVTIKDSVYAKQLSRIATELVSAGYAVTVQDFNISISWADAK